MADAQEGAPERRFFQDEPLPEGAVRAAAAPYDTPRAMTAATEVLNLQSAKTNLHKHSIQAWQESAWNFTDQIGELKFAFNLVAQIVSRALLYPAVIEGSDSVPIDGSTYLERLPKNAPATKHAVRVAQDAMLELLDDGAGEMLRLMALNLSIPGECYLIHAEGRWMVASISEFMPGPKPYIQRSRERANRRELPANTFAARLWRAHPRWREEADSSMLGVLDQCEKVVLFDQVIRALSRSRLSAGAIVIPNGLTPADGTPLHEAIARLTTEPVENEASAASVTPLVLTGPPDLADKMKRIDLGRTVDGDLLAAYESAIDRMLAGLDIPKNVVTGLADVKFANALVIDDALYKAHIEPLLLLICDTLTTAYLRPKLRKAGVPMEMIRRLVCWYNPSHIVTRPDRSQAASEGYDKYLLSGSAWRSARGFSDLDAPDEEELLRRLALEKVQIPQEVGTTLIENVAPEFFSAKRKEAAEEAGIPDDIQSLLSGNIDPTNGQGGQNDQGTPPNPPSDDITPGGTLPPRDTREFS